MTPEGAALNKPDIEFWKNRTRYLPKMMLSNVEVILTYENSKYESMPALQCRRWRRLKFDRR